MGISLYTIALYPHYSSTQLSIYIERTTVFVISTLVAMQNPLFLHKSPDLPMTPLSPQPFPIFVSIFVFCRIVDTVYLNSFCSSLCLFDPNKVAHTPIIYQHLVTILSSTHIHFTLILIPRYNDVCRHHLQTVNFYFRHSICLCFSVVSFSYLSSLTSRIRSTCT